MQHGPVKSTEKHDTSLDPLTKTHCQLVADHTPVTTNVVNILIMMERSNSTATLAQQWTHCNVVFGGRKIKEMRLWQASSDWRAGDPPQHWIRKSGHRKLWSGSELENILPC